MVDKSILRLTPKRIFCPLCGGWHDWKGEKLQFYDDVHNAYEYECNEVTVSIWVVENHIHFYAESLCYKWKEIDLDADLRYMVYDATDPVIRIPFIQKVNEIICKSECEEECVYCDRCNFVTSGDNRYAGEDEYKLKLEFKFEFASGSSRYFNKYAESAREEKLRQQHEAEEAKHQEELARQTKSKTTDRVKEDATMANNIFNMNMEFGPSKDENIASTLMGVAVKDGDSWRIYDKKKKEITDVGDMQLGNLPIFILPTTKLNEGDLIKDAGEYYFVIKVAKGSTQTLCAKTGELKTVIPIKNVLGFSCYSKVIALSDSINMGDDFDVEKLAIMSAMCGQSGENGGQMNQLLPLMLFKDKLSSDDDMMKMMLMTSMMSVPAEGGDQNATMNQLLPLMLLKEDDGGDDDKMKMFLMSSMMGGNMAGNNNPVMSYLMLDMFMGKKKDEKAQQPAQAPTENPAE